MTGSTRGIGRAICERFAREGASVVVTGRTTDDGEEVAATIHRDGGEAIFVRCDVAVEDEVRATFARTRERFGRLDVLVNSAAAMDVIRVGPNRRDGAVQQLETDAWEILVRGGATSAYWACKYAIPDMIESGGGSIISLSSAVAARGSAGMAGHSASKAALEAITRSVAVECGRYGIRANSLVLGFIVDSAGHESVMEDPVQGPAIEAMHLTRLGTTDDVASAAVFLASDEAGFITGVSLPIDGGVACLMPGDYDSGREIGPAPG